MARKGPGREAQGRKESPRELGARAESSAGSRLLVCIAWVPGRFAPVEIAYIPREKRFTIEIAPGRFATFEADALARLAIEEVERESEGTGSWRAGPGEERGRGAGG